MNYSTINFLPRSHDSLIALCGSMACHEVLMCIVSIECLTKLHGIEHIII